MSQITHQPDPDDGHMVQIVPPETLKQLLDEDGDTYDRPDWFYPEDEWNVGE